MNKWEIITIVNNIYKIKKYIKFGVSAIVDNQMLSTSIVTARD